MAIGPVIDVARLNDMIHFAIAVVVKNRANGAIDWQLQAIRIGIEDRC